MPSKPSLLTSLKANLPTMAGVAGSARALHAHQLLAESSGPQHPHQSLPRSGFNSIPPPAAGAPLLLPPCTPEGKACQPCKQRGIEGQGASVMVLIISFRSMVLACQRQGEHSELCSSTDISSIITKKKSNFNATFRDHSHF